MTTHTVASRILAATAILTLGAALAGCGSSSTTAPGGAASTPPSPAPTSSSAAAGQAHNQADIAFVQGMIPHHTQAVDMSKAAAQRANSPQVKDLAARIEAAQQPEIDQMNGMLQAWNASMAAGNDPGMGGMDHSNTGQGGMGQMDHGSMPGMMSGKQMQQLNQLSGAAFDRMFLQMMIEHHQGAITMSKTELGDGQSSDAKDLAQRIIDAQQREISEMQTLLG